MKDKEQPTLQELSKLSLSNWALYLAMIITGMSAIAAELSDLGLAIAIFVSTFIFRLHPQEMSKVEKLIFRTFMTGGLYAMLSIQHVKQTIETLVSQ